MSTVASKEKAGVVLTLFVMCPAMVTESVGSFSCFHVREGKICSDVVVSVISSSEVQQLQQRTCDASLYQIRKKVALQFCRATRRAPTLIAVLLENEFIVMQEIATHDMKTVAEAQVGLTFLYTGERRRANTGHTI